jgi:hypothetical protein
MGAARRTPSLPPLLRAAAAAAVGGSPPPAQPQPQLRSLTDLPDELLEQVLGRLLRCGDLAAAGGSHGVGGVAGGRHGGGGDLAGAARLGLTCRRLQALYAAMLARRRSEAGAVAAAAEGARERRVVLRRYTQQQHNAYCKHELALQFALFAAAAAALAATCRLAPAACALAGDAAPVLAFVFTHLLTHHALLAAAARCAAAVGERKALVRGLAALAAYYLLLCPAASAVLGTGDRLPESLDLAPWRPNRTRPPRYLPAALLWPFFGGGWDWRLVSVLTNGAAWAFGIAAWRREWRFMAGANGLSSF